MTATLLMCSVDKFAAKSVVFKIITYKCVVGVAEVGGVSLRGVRWVWLECNYTYTELM